MDIYKEKYEQALENIKKIKAANKDNKELVDFIEYQYPELKESEDDEIRHYLIDFVKINDGVNLPPDDAKKAIAWLEKQGEQKHEIKYIYPKFRVGDVIEPAKPNGYCPPVRVKYIGEGNYSCESDDHKSFLSFPICNEDEYVLTKQKSAEWSENDEEWMKSIFDKLSIGGDMCLGEKCWIQSIKERMKGE